MIGELIIIVLFIVSIKLRAVYACPQGKQDWLSKETFLSERGCWALLVVLSHVWCYTVTLDSIPVLWPFHMIKSVGHLGVAVFFFLSGYGMSEQYKETPSYLERFISKKIFRLLAPYWFVNVAYCIVYFVSTDEVNPFDLLISFVYPKFNAIAWYIFAIFLFDIFYYYILKIFGRKHLVIQELLLFVFTGCYSLVVFLLKLGSWWYVASLGFVIGVFVSNHKNKMYSWGGHRITLIIVSIFFLALHFVQTLVVVGDDSRLHVLLGIVSASVFAVLVPLYRMRWYLKSRALDFIGKYSLWIYLVQGLYIHSTKLFARYISNDFLVNELIILGGIVFSVVFGMGLRKVYDIVFLRFPAEK